MRNKNYRWKSADTSQKNAILYADDYVSLAISEDELQIIAYQLNFIANKYKWKSQLSKQNL
jgi:hypothetical protein